MDHYSLLKKQICEIGKRIYQRGYVASNDGNISVKVNNSEFLATPTGVSKGFMTPEMILCLGSNMKLVHGIRNVSSEIKMHAKVYEKRDDINAVVHAHCPYATAFAVAGIPLDKAVLPEIVATLGSIPLAPYATPSTNEVPDSISELIQKSDALLLANHGVLTVGETLEQAYMRLESVEHFAKVYYLALQIGRVSYLSEKDTEKLENVRKKLGIKGKYFPPVID